MAKRALIVVDMSNDFVHDNGSLSAGKKAQAIVPAIIEALNVAFTDPETTIVFAHDLHVGGVDHDWPKHNEPGTWGHELYGEIGEWKKQHVCAPPLEQFEDPATKQPLFRQNEKLRKIIWIDKTSYNAFWHTDLADRLRVQGVEEVIITGVCTDICVFNTAAGAFDEGFKITIPRATCATFSDYGEAALKMAELQFKAKIV